MQDTVLAAGAAAADTCVDIIYLLGFALGPWRPEGWFVKTSKIR